MNDLLHNLSIVLPPIGQIFLTILIGGVVFRLRFFERILGLLRIPCQDMAIHGLLSKAILWVTLPSLLFAKLAYQRDVNATFPGWYWLPLIAMGVLLFGAGVGYLTSFFLPNEHRYRPLLICMTAFKNSGYLPLALVRGIFPEYPQLDVLVMIYILGVSPFLWSVSPAVMRDQPMTSIPWRKLINPPLVGILLGFVAMLSGFSDMLAHHTIAGYDARTAILLPFLGLGESTLMLILLVLGGTLASMLPGQLMHSRFVGLLVFSKLLLVPACGLLLIPYLGLSPEKAILVAVMCMSPPAINLTIQAREYATKEISEIVHEGVLFNYLFAGITLTVFVTLARMILIPA